MRIKITDNTKTASSMCAAAMLAIVCGALSGCEGKSLIDDNPVFADAPPRLRATNSADLSDQSHADSVVRAVSHSESAALLSGNSVVAEVNGNPIFVDDLIGSLRLSFETGHPEISDEEKQAIMREQIRKRLPAYIDQEIVLQTLNRAVPEDKRQLIRQSLEEPFQSILESIRTDNNVTTDDELNAVLAEQGMSIDLLRESFLRIQMVQGYLSSRVNVSETVDRAEIVDYYNRHREQFTSKERVRVQEIVVNFDDHGGKEAARELMADVIRELQKGTPFDDVAVRYSDALSAEKRGDIGWVYHNSLADKALEDRLFSLAAGEMTKVYVRDDRFEVFHVVEHQAAATSPLQDVQKEIESKILEQRRTKAREEQMKELRDSAIVVTIFDEPDTSPSTH